MKVRIDFVSNSSSSSFIIAKTDVFDHFKIGKNDIEMAIADLWTGTPIDTDSVDDPSHPYDIYEMPFDRAKAIRMHGSILQSWNQALPIVDEWDPDRDAIQAFDNLLNCLSRVNYNWSFLSGDSNDLKYSSAPDYVKRVVKEARENLEIKTADEVLLDDNTQFFIHFCDNEILSIRGITDNANDANCSQRFETPNYTCERFIEILFKWLVAHGKIDPKDPILLAKYPCLDSVKEKNPGKISWLKDDIYTWKDFLSEGIKHAMFHEG